MLRMGIIGSAVVGQTLARGLKKHGYEVRIASRTPAKLAEFSSSTGIAAGTVAEVSSWADAIVLAVKSDCERTARRRRHPGLHVAE
jgi:3-hydroxyisobutyrate dehydrogenase-like beta-hydroxyacid dehydrogenase